MPIDAKTELFLKKCKESIFDRINHGREVDVNSASDVAKLILDDCRRIRAESNQVHQVDDEQLNLVAITIAYWMTHSRQFVYWGNV